MTQRTRETGATLLEAMIAIAILTVGMLGLMQLQIMGIYSNQGARANTTAAQLGRELLSGLEALPTDSGLLSATTEFGPLLKADGSALAAREYTDTTPVAGVRTNASLERDPEDGTVSIYRRRWTVLNYGPPGAEASVRRLAVSVIWRERGLSRPRELVLYGQRSNPGAVLSSAAAFR